VNDPHITRPPDSARAVAQQTLDTGDQVHSEGRTDPWSGAARAGLTPLSRAPAGYEILGELGRGGMGVVYRAKHVKLNRVVALKMILAAEHAGPEELERFRTEAEAIARLNHPNIVQIFDIGELDGRPFFSLEYCSGGSLEGRLKNGPLPPRQAAEIVETLAYAMQAAHDAGLIHRDLKPANVLLLADGTPKITDFGLAKKLEIEEGRTRTGAILGTPSYMAPEQAEGKKQVGPPADIYALGGILYRLLTAELPFHAATPLDTILKVLSAEVVPPRLINSKSPRDLETICLKCLRKQPGQRYASAADLAEDLRRFLDGRPIKARPMGTFEKAWRWARTNPTLAGLLAATVVGMLVTMFQQYALFSGVTQPKVNLAPLPRPPDRPNLLPKEAQPEPPKLPRPTWHLTRTLTGPSGRLWAVAFDPSGSRVAAAGEDGSIHFWNMATGERERRLSGHDDTIHALAFSPDGRWLVSAGADQVAKVWDAAVGRQDYTLQGHHQTVQAVAFDPTGRYLATGSRDRTTLLWDSSTWRPIVKLQGHERGVNALSFNPEGTLLATAGDDRTIRIWNIPGGTLLHTLKGHADRITDVTFVAGGKRLLSVGWDRKALEWDVAAGRPAGDSAVMLGFGIRFNTLARPADRSLLAAGGWASQILITDEKGLRVFLSVGSEQTTRLAFSKDGKQLAAAGWDGAVRVWSFTASPASGKERRGD
jgi:serine/threonine protein kinase